MERLTRLHHQVGLLAALALAGPLAGCGDETRFFIVQNQSPDEGCLVSPEATHAYRGQGRLDLTLVSSQAAFAYRLYPLIRNDLPRAGQAGAIEANRLALESFAVEVELGPEAPAGARKVFDDLAASETGRRLLAFEEPIAANLEPGGGLAATGVGALPTELARMLLASGAVDGVAFVRASIKVRARGRREGGVLETPVFRFPLEICTGCLAHVVAACPLPVIKNAGHACNIAQDDPVDCCTESGGVRCPARIANPTMTAPATTTP